jgi:hypothetical protein
MELWRRYPAPVIGVCTGGVSGLDVLDLDAKHAAARSWWAEHRHRVPRTRVHRTRSGGLHIFFQHAPGVRCTAGRITLGVDTRGDGGYVIWWPAAGCSVLSDADVVPWPQWLLEIVQAEPAAAPSSPVTVPDDRALAGLVRTVANAPVGRRNNILFWAACRLGEKVSSRLLDEPTALAILVEAARFAGVPLLDARRSALSGLRTGGSN